VYKKREVKTLNKKLNDGVGKKIVEALKRQSEGELPEIKETSSAVDGLIPNIEETVTLADSAEESDFSDLLNENSVDEVESVEETVLKENKEEDKEEEESFTTTNSKEDESIDDSSFTSVDLDSFEVEETKPKYNSSELNELEIPANILILKKLISQLPSGVTRHTGAQIIKQTMEALGISMKNVLKEAQDVQENLKESAKECQATTQEYRKQITVLEKQSQKYQKQYGALNDLISLFIQTTK